jgi:hypothetical protein
MPSAQTTYPSASTATAYPVPPPTASTALVDILGRGDIPIQGRGIVDVVGCITVGVL